MRQYRLINLIKLHYLYKKKFFKKKLNKLENPIIQQLVKINVIKYVKKTNKIDIIFLNFNEHVNLLKIKKIHNKSNKKSIALFNLQKLTKKTKSLILVNTSQGLLTNTECLQKKISGIPSFQIIL